MTAKAIVTLDPAGSADCGLAVRFVDPTPRKKGARIPKPDYYYTGSVWNEGLHDDLATTLAKRLRPGDAVVFAAEANTYNSYRLARSCGRAVGCVEGLLIDLNVLRADSVHDIYATQWRSHAFTKEQRDAIAGAFPKHRRALWKKLAQEVVLQLYAIETTHDAAEAILMCDYVTYGRRDLWVDGVKG